MGLQSQYTSWFFVGTFLLTELRYHWGMSLLLVDSLFNFWISRGVFTVSGSATALLVWYIYLMDFSCGASCSCWWLWDVSMFGCSGGPWNTGWYGVTLKTILFSSFWGILLYLLILICLLNSLSENHFCLCILVCLLIALCLSVYLLILHIRTFYKQFRKLMWVQFNMALLTLWLNFQVKCWCLSFQDFYLNYFPKVSSLERFLVACLQFLLSGWFGLTYSDAIFLFFLVVR